MGLFSWRRPSSDCYSILAIIGSLLLIKQDS
jgi:hypothetical protein